MTVQLPFTDEKHFHQFANFIPLLVWTAHPDGFVDYFNKQWYDFSGFEESQGDQSWIPILHPDDVQLCIDTWYNSVQTGEGYEIEYRFKDRKKPGHYRWFLGRACPIRDDEGQIIKWIGTCTDIDDQKRQAEILDQRIQERTQELDRLNSELQRSNQQLQQFTYVASHDLQEPLRKIQSFGDLLVTQFGPGLGNTGVDMIKRMQTASTRMSVLIRDLLTYSRLSGHRDLFEVVNLSGVVSEVLDDLEVAIQQSGAEIQVGALPTLQGNPLQLRQLFQNLLSNALKFRQPGLSPQVHISSQTISGADLPANLKTAMGKTVYSSGSQYRSFWEIAVADNGIGLEEQHIDRIFQVFERLHGKYQYDGTGVGLAICRKVAEMHGGGITVRSQPGQGATFLVYLPA